MKRMLPVYILQIAMIATFAFVGYRITNKLASIDARMAAAQEQREQLEFRSGFGAAPLQVEVVNTPTVEVESVIPTLDVNVVNEPTVDINQ